MFRSETWGGLKIPENNIQLNPAAVTWILNRSHCGQPFLPYAAVCSAKSKSTLQTTLSMLKALKFGYGRWLPAVCRSMSAQALPCAKGAWHVSSHGRCCNSKGSISLGYLTAAGYRSVKVAEENWMVHRVVKLTFHGAPSDESTWQVHHRDGNKGNNRLENLEFVSNSVNTQHSHANPSRGSGASSAQKPVLWRPVGSQSWNRCPSVILTARHLGISASTISKGCKDRSPAKGFEFCFEEVLQPTLEGEEWRKMVDPVTGDEVPRRMISSLGRVMLPNGFAYHGCRADTGYYRTSVRSNGVSRKHYVHRLVAASFIGLPQDPQRALINHKDGDKSNNAVVNLEYTTHAENMSHHFSLAGRKPSQHQSRAKPVWSRACGSGDMWKWHMSITEAANARSLRMESVSACARGLVKQAGGYDFCFADAPDALSLPGEEWRPVNIAQLFKDKEARRRAAVRLGQG